MTEPLYSERNPCICASGTPYAKSPCCRLHVKGDAILSIEFNYALCVRCGHLNACHIGEAYWPQWFSAQSEQSKEVTL